MSKLRDRFDYNFGDIVLTGVRASTRYRTTWYLNCPECKGQHMFRQTGSKVWHTSCELFDIEWTITPREYFVGKKIDLTLILGDENENR